MVEQQCKQLIIRGDYAVRRHRLDDARRYYRQSISEVNLCLKCCRAQYLPIESRDRVMRLVSMVVVAHHNMADLFAMEGGRESQRRYLEMAHEALVDIVRDNRFNNLIRVLALGEMKRTYTALVCHYKTHCLATALAVLNEQYTRLNRMFVLLA